MVRAKFNYPDLDVLDSPLMSPTPLTSVGGIPGSAIAEKIFNDPDSWEESDDTDADVPEDLANDPLAWLVDEIERFRENSADIHGAFDLTVHDKRRLDLMTPPAGGKESGTGLKGIGRTTVRPISITSFFEPANDEDIQAQLSKILDSGGIPHHIRPLSSALSPPSTATSSNISTPLQINSASTVASSTEDGPSPVAIYSSSTTMSFLEWYGIYPDSPLNSRSIMQQRRKTAKPKNPALVAPSPRHVMRSSSLVSPSPSRDTFPRPPEKRVSSVPPPGLEPPTHLLRAQSPAPAPTPNQPSKPSNPLDVSSRVSSTSPPPHTRTPSPAGSRPNSNPSSRSSSNSSQPCADVPVQGMSNPNPIGIARRRRLPSIPLDPSAERSSSLKVQVHSPSRLTSPPLRSSTVPPSSLLTATFAPPVPTSQLQQSASRPLSASRPPLVGPAGPRTRASQSRMNRQDAITRGTSLTHRPPVLRL